MTTLRRWTIPQQARIIATRGVETRSAEVQCWVVNHPRGLSAVRLEKLRPRENEKRLYALSAPYFTSNGNVRWNGDEIFAEDVNAPEVLDFLTEREPDLAFARCINNYFGKKLRSIPKHGVLLWHEGITPEYRGLHSPFWALHNLDFDEVGYTLLRMNDQLDAGEIFAQGRIAELDPRRDTPSYLGHKAIAESLPAVERFLRELETGTATPIDRSGAESPYYSYPGLSDLVRFRLRLRRWQGREGRAGAPSAIGGNGAEAHVGSSSADERLGGPVATD